MNNKIHSVTLPKGEKLVKYCRSRNCQCQEYVKYGKNGKKYHVRSNVNTKTSKYQIFVQLCIGLYLRRNLGPIFADH